MAHQEQDRYIVRFPNGWRDVLKRRAAENRRSLNQEILAALESVVEASTGGKFGDRTPVEAGMNRSVSSAAIPSNG